MGMIGKWIDERCQAEPAVMRRVLNRKFGPLESFFTNDHTCGCLVGSWALARGDTDYAYDDEATRVGIAVAGLTEYGGFSADVRHKRPDAFVIRLLKQRIRRALGLAPQPRETLALVGSRPPRNPE